MDYIDYTATGQGYYRVYLDGDEVSKHTQEREALEAATNLILSNPLGEVNYVHDYNVMVTLTTQGVTLANQNDTQINNPPTIDSTPSPTFTEGLAANYSMLQHASDPDGDPLSFTVQGSLPQGISFVSPNLIYDGVAGATVASNITVTVSDGQATDISSPFTITIAAVSQELDPPAANQSTYYTGNNNSQPFHLTANLGWRGSSDIVKGYDWAFPPTHVAKFAGIFQNPGTVTNGSGGADSWPAYNDGPKLLRHNVAWKDINPTKNTWNRGALMDTMDNLGSEYVGVHCNIRGNCVQGWNNSGNLQSGLTTAPAWLLDEPSSRFPGDTVGDHLYDEGWNGGANTSRRHINLDLREQAVLDYWVRLIEKIETWGYFEHPKLHNQLLHAVSNSLGEEATGTQWDDGGSTVQEDYKVVIQAWMDAFTRAGTQHRLMWLKDSPASYIAITENAGAGKRAGGAIESWQQFKWLGGDELGLDMTLPGVYRDANGNQVSVNNSVGEDLYITHDNDYFITKEGRAFQDQNEVVSGLGATDAYHYRMASLRGIQTGLDNLFLSQGSDFDPRQDWWVSYQLGQQPADQTAEGFIHFGAFWGRGGGVLSTGEYLVQNTEKYLYQRETTNPTTWGERRNYVKNIGASGLPTNLRYGWFSKRASSVKVSTDPAWINGNQPIVIKITYKDEGTGTFQLSYTKTGSGRNTRTLTKNNSGDVRTVTWYLPDFRSTDTGPNDGSPAIQLNTISGSNTEFYMMRIIKN